MAIDDNLAWITTPQKERPSWLLMLTIGKDDDDDDDDDGEMKWYQKKFKKVSRINHPFSFTLKVIWIVNMNNAV